MATESTAMADAGLNSQQAVRHAVKTIRFEDINKNLDLLRTGDIVGRAVVAY